MKVVVGGPPGVGKSSLTKFISERVLPEAHAPTIGAEFNSTVVRTCSPDGTLMKTKLELWSTAGSLQFRRLITSYFKSANVNIFMYAVDDPVSLNEMKDIIADVLPGSHCDLVLIVGNKTDLKERVAAVDIESIVGYTQGILEAGDNGAKVVPLKISVKENTNIDAMVRLCIDELGGTGKLTIFKPLEILDTTKSRTTCRPKGRCVIS